MKKDFKFLKCNGKRAVLLLSLTIIVSLFTIGGTLAYIFVETGILESIFAPAKVEVQVSGNEIVNNSEIPVYARVAIVVSLVKDGVTLSEEAEYTLETESNWVKGSDGYWYYTSPISQGDSVAIIKSVTEGDVPEGCVLTVEILSTVIQSTPVDAVKNSWVIVTVNNDGTLNVQ